MLNIRESTILNNIIEAFIDSGMPIGSRTLVKSFDIGLSSATIRNVMSDLEEYGYLIKTHHSSGRIPSSKAIELYVHNLINSSSENRHYINMDDFLEDEKNRFEHLIVKASKLLSSMTEYATLTFVSREPNPVIKELFLKELGDNQILFLLVLDNDQVYNKIIDYKMDKGDISIEIINNFLEENFKSKTIDYFIKNLNPLFFREFKLDFKNLTGYYEDIDFSEDDELKIEGIERLLMHPELSERVNQIAQIMENDSSIKDLIFNDINNGINVFIGDEEGALEKLSVITSSYKLDDDRWASFGIIAPIRINYGNAISTIIKLDRDIAKYIARGDKNAGR